MKYEFEFSDGFICAESALSQDIALDMAIQTHKVERAMTCEPGCPCLDPIRIDEVGR